MQLLSQLGTLLEGLHDVPGVLVIIFSKNYYVLPQRNLLWLCRGLCKGCARGCARGCAGGCAKIFLDKGLCEGCARVVQELCKDFVR